jgi:crotonobetainyl-CoA:carnitine CoA-transferase CaiB-like acyl-CoA transferase
MITNPLQKKPYDAVSAALPFPIDPGKITIEPGVSYIKSPVKVHDYAVGVMAAFGSVVEHIGVQRGLPSQTMTLSRRRCGLLLNSIQLHFLNGYCTLMDSWPLGPDNGTYRAADGRYVTMIGLHPHLRDGLLKYFDCPNTAQAIAAAVEKKPAQQIEDEVAGLYLPFGMVRSLDEWLDHPQGAATAQHEMIDIEQVGNARKRHLGAARHRPLDGVRAVELTHLVAGPTIGRLLAEQGADVIKVQPPMGDWVTPLWLDVSWGKRNISTDVKSRSGGSRFRALLAGADVLVDSLRPGALERLGLTTQALQEINPNLILARVSASGTPWQNRVGLEQIAQSVAGNIHANSAGLPEPTVIAALMNDYLTGYLGAIGVIAGLSEREEKGGYWNVEASLTRCAMMGSSLVEPVDGEEYAAVTVDDLVEHAVDQQTPAGVVTRLREAVEFSHTPSMFLRPTSWPDSSPDTIVWLEGTATDGPPKPPHYPSRMARDGGIRNLVSCYGIVDRGDGGGGFSLASKELMEYVAAQRNL